MTIQAASNVPYSQRRREGAMAAMPRLALDATDAYVAGLATLKPDLGLAPVLAGGLAVLHTGFAISQVVMANPLDELHKRRSQTMALGEFITAAGFVGLAAGLGIWALPVMALGEVTTNFARFS